MYTCFEGDLFCSINGVEVRIGQVDIPNWKFYTGGSTYAYRLETIEDMQTRFNNNAWAEKTLDPGHRGYRKVE